MKTRMLMFACLMAALVACNKEEDPTPTPTAGGLSCTMAIYGSAGGGNDNGVDVDYVNELIDAMRFGPTERLNVVAQFNFASNDPKYKYVTGTAFMRLLKQDEDIYYIGNDDLDYKGCKNKADSNEVRMNVVEAKLKELVEGGAYSFTKLNDTVKTKLYLPSEISKFLDRTAKECPADHYLFCLSGHGGAWSASDDRDNTKAVAYDDNFSDTAGYAIGISAKNLVAGINGSTIASKIPVVYFNACKMNFLENICEYAACPVTYALTSFKITNGTENNFILQEFDAATGNGVSDLTDALLKAFARVYKKKACDVSLVNIKSMKNAAAGVKDLVPLLKDDYKDDPKWYITEIYNLNCPDTTLCSDKDFSQFLDDLVKEPNIDSAIRAKAGAIRGDIQSSIVKTIYGDSCSVKTNLLTGAKFIGKKEYANSRAKYAASYDNNEFYKISGWNTLFEVFDDSINGDEE